ncbi:MAG: 2-C-methyl-D-erythritol 2,4-cyclodiphosphate synthase [bacterium]|nr:2-C-methyl-D-erythritol 2,4-cyclodiphosphate synthase [bacterium]
MNSENLFVGIGFDSHRFKKGNGLILAGVFIPFDKSFDAHSDGDIVCHSIIDAILGALPIEFEYNNIGTIFPDNDPKFKNANSLELLNTVVTKISNEFVINNCDVIVVLQEPKLRDYLNDMISNLKRILKTERVNIKPKTGEFMGFIGNKEGAAAFSVISISKKRS